MEATEPTAVTDALPTVHRASDPVADARYHDIARRLLQGVPREEVRLAHDIPKRTFTRLLHSPEFQTIYLAVRRALYEDVDAVIADEKTSIAIRQAAIQSRAVTLLGEVVEAARAHIRDAETQHGSKGAAKSTMLRAGVEAVRAATDMVRAAGGTQSQRSVGGIAVQVNVHPDQAETIRSTLVESGVDLSDILDAEESTDGTTDNH